MYLGIGYQQIQERTETEGYVYYANETVSNLGNARYLTELAGPDKYALNNGFVSDACRLPGTYSENEYMTFLNTWGTVRNREKTKDFFELRKVYNCSLTGQYSDLHIAHCGKNE